jgi:hypothetical protein
MKNVPRNLFVYKEDLGNTRVDSLYFKEEELLSDLLENDSAYFKEEISGKTILVYQLIGTRTILAHRPFLGPLVLVKRKK